jgi:hypothetical protein
MVGATDRMKFIQLDQSGVKSNITTLMMQKMPRLRLNLRDFGSENEKIFPDFGCRRKFCRGRLRNTIFGSYRSINSLQNMLQQVVAIVPFVVKGTDETSLMSLKISRRHIHEI